MTASMWILVVAVAVLTGLKLLKSRSAQHRAQALLDRNPVLLDVRTPAEFQRSHAEGALNIPVQELKQRLEELGSRETPILVYCQAGGRAAVAAHQLRGAGFETVVNIGTLGAAQKLLDPTPRPAARQ